MTAREQWMSDPNLGGMKIRPAIQADVERRIRRVTEEHFNGQFIGKPEDAFFVSAQAYLSAQV